MNRMSASPREISESTDIMLHISRGARQTAKRICLGGQSQPRQPRSASNGPMQPEFEQMSCLRVLSVTSRFPVPNKKRFAACEVRLIWRIACDFIKRGTLKTEVSADWFRFFFQTGRESCTRECCHYRA